MRVGEVRGEGGVRVIRADCEKYCSRAAQFLPPAEGKRLGDDLSILKKTLESTVVSGIFEVAGP
jgi:hypothetical protein